MQNKSRDWELWNNPKLVSSMDEYWQGDVFRVHRQKVRDVISSLFSRDPECRTVLEFGCGTGNYVPIVRQLGREYVGVDVTEVMRETAQRRFPGVPFQIDDIFQSKQPNGSYDVVLSADVLVHLPEFDQPFATLWRIARRHVVLKLCYLTQRKGLARYLRGERRSFVQRNSQGFIEHFFNLKEVTKKIESSHQPGSISTFIFGSNQTISPYQAILVISKPGMPRLYP